MQKSPTHQPCQRNRQWGTGMIEVMVSCLVLSAGLSAIAAMQAKAIVNSTGASIQASLVQGLQSFNEARLLDPNVFNQGGVTCNGAGAVSTTASEITFLKNYFTAYPALCPTAFTLAEYNTDKMSPSCFEPIKISRNLFCTSSGTNYLIDLRNPVWMP